MTLYHLIYNSRPFGYDEATLGAILNTARANNARDGVTGTLICRDDLFLQFLEGPEEAVEAAFGRIARDDRHIEVSRLLSGPADARRFPEWAMRHDPVRDWMWSRAEVDAGALSGASTADLLRVFDRVASDPEDAAAGTCPRG
jgi:hypothetical protein